MNQDRAREPKGCARGCVILLAVLTALIFAGFLVARHLVRRGMTSAERAEMDAFFEEPVEIPAKWQETYAFPQDVVNAAGAAGAAYVFFDGSDWWDPWWKLQEGEELESEEWRAIEKVVEWYRPFTQAMRELVNLPVYELEAYTSTDDFLRAQVAAKILSLQSYLLARDGQWSDAFEPSLTALRIGRRHPASGVTVHLIAFACQGIGSRCIARLAPECEDAEALKHALDEMNRLDTQLNLDVLDDPMLNVMVGELRSRSRAGLPVDLASKAPREYFFRQFIELRQMRGEPVIRSGPTNPWHVKALAKTARYSRPAAEALYRISWPYYSDVHIHEQTTKSLYDLTRLAVAGRIYELETGRSVQSLSDLVPAYVPGPLLDPFSNKEYLRSKEMEVFYSLGPDQTDNRCGVLYDPTNGTTSAGDILMRR